MVQGGGSEMMREGNIQQHVWVEADGTGVDMCVYRSDMRQTRRMSIY